MVSYNCNGVAVDTKSTTGLGTFRRLYIPGLSSTEMIAGAGPVVVSYYSTAVYRPGSRIKWEPSCSFNTTGRLYVGFTDNPEVIVNLNVLREAFKASPSTTTYNAYADLVKGLGSCISFPVWQETELPFPTRLRRKRFDTDTQPGITTDNLDRACQLAMFVALEAGPATAQVMGNFWFHDNVDVEGLHPVVT